MALSSIKSEKASYLCFASLGDSLIGRDWPTASSEKKPTFGLEKIVIAVLRFVMDLGGFDSAHQNYGFLRLWLFVLRPFDWLRTGEAQEPKRKPTGGSMMVGLWAFACLCKKNSSEQNLSELNLFYSACGCLSFPYSLLRMQNYGFILNWARVWR